MFLRILAVSAFVICVAGFSVSAQAGDYPDNPGGCKGYPCPPNPAPVPPPHHQPTPPPHHHPEPTPGPMGLCDGVFEGWYFGQNEPVTFDIQQTGPNGELAVTSFFRGGQWQGQGICRQVGPCQAAIELYFPGAPVHRGVVNSDARGFAVMDGQVDYGFAFRLTRRNF